MKQLYLFILLLLTTSVTHALPERENFEWGNATVYFVITDRFCNGDSANDVNYGRIVDYGSERLTPPHFMAVISAACSKKPGRDILQT